MKKSLVYAIKYVHCWRLPNETLSAMYVFQILMIILRICQATSVLSVIQKDTGYSGVVKTLSAEGVPRHCKVTLGFPELPTMTADGSVREGRGLSFDASPPDVPLSSIWADRDSEGLEGSDGTERSSGRIIYVDFRLRKHT